MLKPRKDAETILQKLDSPAFTSAEKKIARTLLANYPRAGLDSVARFAAEAHTSHPTILRFVAKLGFANYGEFQTALLGEVESHFQTLPQRFDAYSSIRQPDTLLDQFVHAAHENIDSAYHMAPRSAIEAVAKLLADERRSVYLIGFALTYPLAAWFYNYWKIVRTDVHQILPGTKHFTHILDMRKRDVVILFQMPRYEDHVTQFGAEVIRRGINLVVFTDNIDAPLASKAKHVFAAPVKVPSLLDSYMGTVLQLELLTVALIDKLGGRCRDRMNSLESLVPVWEKSQPIPRRKLKTTGESR